MIILACCAPWFETLALGLERIYIIQTKGQPIKDIHDIL